MSKLQQNVLDASYDATGCDTLEQRFNRFFRPPYTLAVEDGGALSVYAHVKVDDLRVICGLVMELNAGRAGRGGRNKQPKRRWLFMDKALRPHYMDSGSVLKTLGTEELRRRNKVYRTLHNDRGRRGYIGPDTAIGQITDPTALRVMQSQLGRVGGRPL